MRIDSRRYSTCFRLRLCSSYYRAKRTFTNSNGFSLVFYFPDHYLDGTGGILGAAWHNGMFDDDLEGTRSLVVNQHNQVPLRSVAACEPAFSE